MRLWDAEDDIWGGERKERAKFPSQLAEESVTLSRYVG